MPEGKIKKALSGFYYVEAGGKTYQTRGRGNFRKRGLTPLVGDEVFFESSSATDGMITELKPRRNQLVRPPVANVDQAIVVMSCVEPDFSTALLDRFLVVIEHERIAPVLYLSKTDILPAEKHEIIAEFVKVYREIGYPVIWQTEGHDALAELGPLLADKVNVLVGQSGAGKSTLLNQLKPDLKLETAAISSYLGRGKHTTRHVELLEVGGGLVADTPGFSSLDFTDISAVELGSEFPEIHRTSQACKFRECLHKQEPHCAVKSAVATGEIAAFRFEAYRQFLEEIEKRKPIYGKREK